MLSSMDAANGESEKGLIVRRDERRALSCVGEGQEKQAGQGKHNERRKRVGHNQLRVD